ncbi:MAG: mechanosensitive ion channel [Candidatus Woesearchaeota archaeon]
MANETIALSNYPIIEKSFSIVPTQVLIALATLFLGFFAGKLVQKLLARFLKMLRSNYYLKRVLKVNLQVEEGVPLIVSYGIYVFTLILVLDYLGVAITSFRIMLWIVFIFFVVSFLLSVWDVFVNLIPGLIFLRKNRIKEGDLLLVDGLKGVVQEVTLTHTTLVLGNNEFALIPHGTLAKKIVRKKRS